MADKYDQNDLYIANAYFWKGNQPWGSYTVVRSGIFSPGLIDLSEQRAVSTLSTCLVGGIFQADRALQHQPKLSIIYTALSAVGELVHTSLCTYT